MTKLQEAFDNVTRMTLAVKKAGQQFIQSHTKTEHTEAMIQKGVQLCKALVVPSELVEKDCVLELASDLDFYSETTPLSIDLVSDSDFDLD